MGFRFYRRVRLLPGISVNLSRRGISTSIGVRGAHATIGHGKVRESIGIPGTGLSYVHVDKTSGEGPGAAQPRPRETHVSWIALLAFAAAVWLLVYLITHHGGRT
jgi:hypothetical protein